MTALIVSTLRDDPAPQARLDDLRRPDLWIETFARIEDCESLWRGIQDEGLATPFQRFDWIAAFLRAQARLGAQIDTRIVVVRSASGDVLMLLPLAIEQRLGLRIASLVGGKQANYKMPIMVRDSGLAASLPPAMLRQAGAMLGIDVYQFLGTPISWEGQRNPLAEFGRPSPSNAFRLDLSATGEETLARTLDRDARKKLRQKERWLARLGAVERIEPVGASATDAVLDAFFHQKSQRLRSLGVHNPFASEQARSFLREACRPAGIGRPPSIELHALTLDGDPVAVFAGAVDCERMSGMVISFDASPAIARCSPGDLLIARVIEAQCLRGRRVFDLGVGEARYKRTFCDAVDPLVDALVPVTESGRLYAAAARLAMDAKRYVKQTSWTMRLVTKMRRSTGSFEPGPPQPNG